MFLLYSRAANSLFSDPKLVEIFAVRAFGPVASSRGARGARRGVSAAGRGTVIEVEHDGSADGGLRETMERMAHKADTAC
jgi:hypothetical protein